MSVDLKKAIKRVHGSNPGNFGTCFCVSIDGDVSYFVTCAHVVQQVIRDQTERNGLVGKEVSVGEWKAKVFASGEDRYDLAILAVRGVNEHVEPIPCSFKAAEGQAYTAHGFHKGSSSSFSVKRIQGDIKYSSFEGWDEVDNFYLHTDHGCFAKGFSGGPVLDKNGRAFGMLTRNEGKNEASALDLSLFEEKHPQIKIALSKSKTRGRNTGVIFPAFLPYRVDRSIPKDDLHCIIQDSESPLVLTQVSGPESAEHDMFLEVFGYEYLDLLGHKPYELSWHNHINGYNKEFYEAVHSKRFVIGRGKKPELAKTITHLPKGHVLVFVDGSVEQIRPAYLQALTDWLQEWQDLTFPKNTQILFCVALRFHDLTGSSIKKLVQRWLNWRLQRLVRRTLGKIKTIPSVGPLESIPRGALKKWSKTVEKEWLKEEFEDYQGDLNDEANLCFDQLQKPVQMRHLASPLRKLLESYRVKLKARKANRRSHEISDL